MESGRCESSDRFLALLLILVTIPAGSAFADPQHLIVMEVVLLHTPVLESHLRVLGDAQPHYRGAFDLDQLTSTLDDQTALVTIMWANNETGVLFGAEQIAQICREKRVPFHCDGTHPRGES